MDVAFDILDNIIYQISENVGNLNHSIYKFGDFFFYCSDYEWVLMASGR